MTSAENIKGALYGIAEDISTDGAPLFITEKAKEILASYEKARSDIEKIKEFLRGVDEKHVALIGLIQAISEDQDTFRWRITSVLDDVREDTLANCFAGSHLIDRESETAALFTSEQTEESNPVGPTLTEAQHILDEKIGVMRVVSEITDTGTDNDAGMLALYAKFASDVCDYADQL